MSSTDTIRELNDAFRTTLSGNSDVYLTAGVAALPEEEQDEIVRRVQGKKGAAAVWMFLRLACRPWRAHSRWARSD